MFDEVLNTPLKFGPSFFSHHFAKPEKNEDFHNIWDKVFKNGPTKICGRQSLKNLNRYGLLKQNISLQIF